MRQKNRQLKSAEENDLISKQKMRKLNALKSKVEEIAKLVKYREKKVKVLHDEDDHKNDSNKNQNDTMR